ncbi:MAG: InlB B-repeat-containing protein [Thermoplasmata archaeon]
MKTKLFVVAITISLLLTGMCVEDISGSVDVKEENQLQTAQEIYDWHDLNDIRDELDSDYVLINDLDKDTEGYDELVNTENGWKPIGDFKNPFTGSFDGNGYEISDLFTNRSKTNYIGLFGALGPGAEVTDVGLIDADMRGDDYVGGFVGDSRGTMLNSYVTGNVSGTDYVGGFCGYNSGRVSNSSAIGNVNGTNNIGGLIGSNWDSVSNSYTTTDVSGNKSIGGLVGYNSGRVSNSYSIGNVKGKSGAVGGLIGANLAAIEKSYSTGNVNGTDYIGGLVGANLAAIENSYSTGNVSGNYEIGGLVGINRDGGMVVDSYSKGNVSGDTGLGGLVGSNFRDGMIERSYSKSDVTGNDVIGGLVGRNYYGRVNNSFARGNVSGRRDVGGLVGRTSNSKIKNSYATGAVNGEERLGGLVGYNRESYVYNSFWDIETSGIDMSDYGTGKTTAEMKNAVTFTDIDSKGLKESWDFVGDPNDDESNDNIWGIAENGNINDGYPFLAWRYPDLKLSKLTLDTKGEGSTGPSQGTHTYENGSIVTIDAEPAGGWKFVKWTGDVSGNETSMNITVDSNKNVTAVFKKVGYDLTINNEGEGNVNPAEGTHTYQKGAEVTIEASPAENWKFVKWTGDVSGTNNTVTVIMNSNKSVTAVFEEIVEYDLTLNVDGEGNTIPTEGTHTYEEGTIVTIEATPADGWNFVEWTGDISRAETNINITMDSNKDVTAVFEEIVEYDFNITIKGKGSVDKGPDQEVYEKWTVVTLNADSEDGWKFVKWTGDATGKDKTINITMDDDKVVTAIFEKREDNGGGTGIRGFTSTLLLLAVAIALIVYYRKKR